MKKIHLYLTAITLSSCCCHEDDNIILNNINNCSTYDLQINETHKNPIYEAGSVPSWFNQDKKWYWQKVGDTIKIYRHQTMLPFLFTSEYAILAKPNECLEPKYFKIYGGGEDITGGNTSQNQPTKSIFNLKVQDYLPNQYLKAEISWTTLAVQTNGINTATTTSKKLWAEFVPENKICTIAPTLCQ